MKIRSKGEYISPVFGNVVKGQIIDMPDKVGQQWINHGLGELVVEKPVAGAAPAVVEPVKAEELEKKSETESLNTSVLQAAPVSQPQTASSLSDGAPKAKRRGRPKRGGS